MDGFAEDRTERCQGPPALGRARRYLGGSTSGNAFLLTDWGGLSVNTGFTLISGFELALDKDLGLQQEHLISAFELFL